MRKGMLAFFFLSSGILAFSQNDLSGSIHHSVYTYVYRVSEKEALSLYKSGMRNLTEKYLHTLVDSIPDTGSSDESSVAGISLPLPPGDYLRVAAAGNKLSAELRTSGDLQYDIINNDHDLVLSFHTREGIPITDAKAFIDTRSIPYDPVTRTYRISRRKKGGSVKVSYQGALYFFPIRKNTQGIYSISTLTRRLFPSSRTYRNRFSNYTSFERRFHSFMVFSKPKYKPGDTVQGKAFLLNRKGRPIDRPLWLRLSDRRLNTDTLIQLVRPYRSGGYSFSFVLTDSLHLSLDKEYLVTLEVSKSRSYTKGDDRGDLDDDEYAAKRKVTARGRFQYEDYSLQSIRFFARADKKENSPGNPVALYLRATDDNELPLPDGRVELQVICSRRADQFHAARVFIKDTLWTQLVSLDPVGETKVTIPDSIFPAANFSYSIHCALLNSSNEYKTTTLYQSYKDDTATFFFTPHADSLGIDLRVSNHPRSVSSMLYAFDAKEDTVERRPFLPPGSIRINPYISRYEVQTIPDSPLTTGNSVSGEYIVNDQKPPITCLASRTKDSVSLEVVNPSHLNFWYTLFAGNKVIRRGYTDQLTWQDRSITAKNYFVSLQYAWSGRIQRADYTVPYREKLLQVAIREPAFVYPGQITTIEIGVKDANGNAVPDADLTAYSFTSKFENVSAPQVPYLGKFYPGRRRFADFSPERETAYNTTLALNWKRWSREMGLGALEYYKFLHPSSIYINTEPARDRRTQIAPFVSWKGELLPVHQLYIDERPVFFSQAQQLFRYSFYISPGRHSLRLRTPDRMIRLDSLQVAEGMKTFICINADTSNRAVRIEKMPDTLTKEEKALWARYMILVENNFGEKFAGISQNNSLYLLNAHSYPGTAYNPTFLTGPLTGDFARFRVGEAAGTNAHSPVTGGDPANTGSYEQDFVPEGNYRFLISKGFIKEKVLPGPYPYPFSSSLDNRAPDYDFHDWVLTETDVDSLWQDYLDERSARFDLFKNPPASKFNSGTLQIGFSAGTGSSNKAELFIKNLFLFRYDDPDFMQIYKGIDRNFGDLQPGAYRLLVLLKGNSYLMADNIQILPDGLNYYAFSDLPLHKQDSVSLRIAGIVKEQGQRWRTYTGSPELDGIRESFNEKYLDPATFPRRILGRVTDPSGIPLAGATVMIKGTRQGTLTDGRGYFQLHTPERGTLVINYIGYNKVEKAIRDTASYEIKLYPASMALNEIVVMGYGMERKRELTGSVSTVSVDNMLMGKVAGIQIRGINPVEGQAQPLVILDGLPYEGDYNKLDQALIGAIRILKPEEATAIYGANAAGGVILITTKKKEEDTGPSPGTASPAGNNLRHHFRDDAFWLPRLSTNEKGIATFTVKYPDDITNWTTMVLAVTGQRQTGFAQGSVKSFKAISATLAVPSFLVMGDSVNVTGKMLNYSPDTVMVRRSFSINDKENVYSTVELHNSRIETFAVHPTPADTLYADSRSQVIHSLHPGATGPTGTADLLRPGITDSIRLKYTLLKKDGYFDGEERVIPVYRKGVKEVKGIFSALEGSSHFSSSLFHPAEGDIRIYAESSVLPVLLDEIENIKGYEYLCNEQLASKLRALLEKRKIFHFLGKEFSEDKNIHELIATMNAARSDGGLWGWWAHNEPALWISLHVTEALLEAEKAGYKTNLNRQLLTDYLVYTLEGHSTGDQLNAIRLLQELDARVDYKRYIEAIEKQVRMMDTFSKGAAHQRLYDKLKLLEIRQAAGMDIRLDSFITRHQETVLGNWYWGEESRLFFDNAFQNTLLLYRLLRTAGGYADVLAKVRNYFLEKRRDGHWRNTYESCLVLETILPDLLTGNTGLPGHSPAVLTPDTLWINGGAPITVFPYKARLQADSPLHFNKKGSLPVYFTAYQEFWNNNPAKISQEFTVQSSFEKEGRQDGPPLSRLKAGEPVKLKTEISVKADADYVMIEIPIPAGCSYKDKEQPFFTNEVHREYFKNKVSIFCRALPKGDYTFTVTLLPRYTGRYQLNPARAELMYFPTFYGREGMREVDIY